MDQVASSQSDKLGELIKRDTSIVRRFGLRSLLRSRSGTGDLGSFAMAQEHPAHRLLCHYKHHGVPVTLADSPWTPAELAAAITRGPHQSAYEYQDFLREDMADMVQKEFWTVVEYDSVRDVPGLRLHPVGVVPQHARRPRPIIDYTFYGVNSSTQPNVPMDSMQFGRTFDRLIRRILLADPAKGRVYLLKLDLSDGFYRINVSPNDIPKLGVVMPTLPGEPPLVAFPIRLPMGWSNSPPAFSVATETVADLANRRLLQHWQAPPHPLEHLASSRPPTQPPLQPLGLPAHHC